MTSKGRTFSRIATTLVMVLGLVTTAALPDSDLPSEMAIKATYVYKFVPFVTWPDTAFASSTSSLTICIVGDGPLADSLSQVLVGQRNGAHGIVVRKLATADSACHVLYIPGNDQKSVRAALDAVRGKPVLTITDMPAGSPEHGIIGFINVADHVRFSIDQAEAAHSGLNISSRLLSLAVSVEM